MKQIQENNFSNSELSEKIKKGLELSFKKLVEAKRKNDEVLIFSKNGVIKKIKAVDIPI